MALRQVGPTLPRPSRGGSLAASFAKEAAEVRQTPGTWLYIKDYPTIAQASTARKRMSETHTDIDWAARTIDGTPWLLALYHGADQPTRRQSFMLVVGDDDGWAQLAESLVDRVVDLRLDDGEHLTNERIVDVKPGSIVLESGPDLHRNTPIPTERITRLYLHAPPEEPSP